MTLFCGSFWRESMTLYDGVGVAEGGVWRLAVRGRDPAGVRRVLVKTRVAEVLAGQQAELPEVIGDVFTDVGDGAVRAHDDLGVFVGAGVVRIELGAGAPHDVAARVLALSLEAKHAALEHDGAGGVPEVQGDDLALAREEVVLDAEPLHGLEMTPKDVGGDEVGDGGGLVVALLEGVQRLEAKLLAGGDLRRVGGVPLGDARVEVPAVEVEALIALEELGEQLLHAVEVLVFEVDEADDDVGDLHAGVVDVVFDADRIAGLEVVASQQARVGVAEDGVAKVADVGGLVGVDAGVLDEAIAGAADVGVLVGGHARDDGGPIEAEVEIAGAGGLDGANAGQAARGDGCGERVGELCGDDAGGLAEALGEVEGERRGELAEGDLRRLLGADLGELEPETLEEKSAKPGDNRLLDRAIHAVGSPRGRARSEGQGQST